MICYIRVQEDIQFGPKPRLTAQGTLQPRVHVVRGESSIPVLYSGLMSLFGGTRKKSIGVASTARASPICISNFTYSPDLEGLPAETGIDLTLIVNLAKRKKNRIS
jgi:hypothetical protein